MILWCITYTQKYTVFQKNDTDVAHNNFTTLILVIFGRDVAEREGYQMMIC